MVVVKLSGTVHEIKKTLAFHGALEILKLKAYVNSGKTYNEERDPELKWEDRSKVVKGRIKTRLLDFLKGCKGRIRVCPLLYTTSLVMYIWSERSTKDQMRSIEHVILASKNGKPLPKANIMTNCLTEKNIGTLLYDYLNENISNDLSTIKKASKTCSSFCDTQCCVRKWL